MEVMLKRGEEKLLASWKFASWADVGLLQGWAEFLEAESSRNMRDASDFARQAVIRWQSYADKQLVVKSREEIPQRVQTRPEDEFVVLLVLKAPWWFAPEHPLAFAYFRRTWCGGLYLEFMAGHPLAEGRIAGILRATIGCLATIAQEGGTEWIWWEATKDSFAKYESIIQEKNAMYSTVPRIKDVFIVHTTNILRLAESR